MKRLVIMLMGSLILLAGCNTKQSYEGVIDAALASPLPPSTNHSKRLYRYYVPGSVGVWTSSQNSTLFNVDGQEVLMNLNVSQIVSKEYYENNEEKPVDFGNFNVLHTFNGSYYDSSGVSQKLNLNIVSMTSDSVAILVSNKLVDLVAVVPASKSLYTLDVMITILRSVEVDNELVVATYSTKEVIDKDAIFSEFFEQVPPENGTLQDMYNQLNPNEDK